MKTTSTNPETFESTYALLLRSEEKQRSRFETLIYKINEAYECMLKSNVTYRFVIDMASLA